MHTLSEIVAYCDKLTASERYDHEIGVHYWSVFGIRRESGICTNSARMIAEKFGGKVFGYEIDTNHERDRQLIGYGHGGHGFAFINDRYIVDWWGCNVDDRLDRPVLDITNPRDAEIIAIRYRRPIKWELVHDYSAKEVGA